MKKSIVVFMVSILLMFSLIGIANAVKQDPIISDGDVKVIVTSFYEWRDKCPTPEIFEQEMTAYLFTELKADNFAFVGALHTVFQEYMDDRISCARNQYEVNELTKKKAGIGLAGVSGLSQFKSMIAKKGMEKQWEWTVNDYFNHIVPSLKKLYREHPDRKFCGSR